MMEGTSFFPVLTTAGSAAAINANNTGTSLAITDIAFGTALYAPTASATALVAEVKRVPVAAGARITPTQIRLYAVWGAVADVSDIGEIGFFAGSVLVAIWSRATGGFIARKSAGVPFVQYFNLSFTSLPSGSITVLADTGQSAILAMLADHESDLDPHMQYMLKQDSYKSYKPLCRAATTANIVLSGLQTVDGTALLAGDRVLVKDQTTAKQNGIYIVAVGAWVRAADMNTADEFIAGAVIPVSEGSVNKQSTWAQTTTGAIVVDTTAVAFARQNAAYFAPQISPTIQEGIWVTSPAGDASVAISSTAGRNRSLLFATAGAARWSLLASAAAESGSNVGSDFYLRRHSDAGAVLDSPMSISRTDGATTFGSAGGVNFSYGATLSTGQSLRFGSASYSYVLGTSGGASYLALGTSGAERARITIGGNLLIGTTTDDGTNKLQVTGNIAVGSGNNVTNPTLLLQQNAAAAGGGTLNITAAGPSSDSNSATVRLHTAGSLWGRTDTVNMGIRFGANDKATTWGVLGVRSLFGTTVDNGVDAVQVNGTISANTPTAGVYNQKLATTEFVNIDVAAKIAALVASSPAALDTLNELAAALGNDANFAATMNSALALRVAKDSDTGSAQLPAGSTAQRSPVPSKGKIRYNIDISRPEIGNGSDWASLGGATGGGTDAVFYLNDQTINNDYTVPAGQNAMTAGPITIANGKTVTISNGSTWTVV